MQVVVTCNVIILQTRSVALCNGAFIGFKISLIEQFQQTEPKNTFH